MKLGADKLRIFVLLVALSAVLWRPLGCGAELVDRIVAIVNDDVITLSELNEAIEPFVKQLNATNYTADQRRQLLYKIRHDALNSMIDQKLTDQESKRLGVSVSQSEVDQQIERIKTGNYYTEEALKKALKDEGYTLEEYRKRIREQLLSLRLINREVKSKIAITEKDIQKYYENHQKDYSGTKQYHLRTILIRVPSWQKAKDKEDALQRMDVVVEALKAGAPFDETAKKYSEDVTSKDGGDLGLFFLDELAPELQETVRWMKEGEVSSVLQTSQGYQILMIEEIRSSAGKTLEQARIEIQEKMYRQRVGKKYGAWLEALRHRSYIKVIQ